MPRDPYTPFDDSVYRPVLHEISTHGIAPDLRPEQLGNEFLASALNFVIRFGRVTRREGSSQTWPTATNDLAAAPIAFHEFISTRSPASAVSIAATPTKFYYTQPAATGWTDVTGTARAGAADNPVLFTSLLTASTGHRIISTNDGVDFPCSWSGATTTTFLNLTTAITGGCCTSWRSHLLLGDTTVATGDGHLVTRVHWSALGDPGTWFGTASTGILDLTDGSASRVMNFVPMRTVLVAYKEEGAYALTYRAAPFYFTPSLMHPSIGPLARRAVAPIQTGERHLLMTQDGVILWDGQNIKPIGRDRIDRTILSRLNWSARHTIWAQWMPQHDEVWLGLPLDGATSVSSVWVYALQYDSWWETNQPFQAVLPTRFTAGRRMTLAGRSIVRPLEALYGVTDTTSATTISSSLQLALFDYGAIEHKGIYKMHVVAGPASGASAVLKISKAGQENPLITQTFASAQSLTVDSADILPQLDFRLTNRWVSYRVEHSGAGETCQVSALVPHLTERTGTRKAH